MIRYNRLYGIILKQRAMRVVVVTVMSLVISLWSGESYAGEVTHKLAYDYSLMTLCEEAGGDGKVYTKIQMPDLSEGSDPGEPTLPMDYIRFLVPSYSRDFHVTVTSSCLAKTMQIDRIVSPVQDYETYTHGGFTQPDSLSYTRVGDIEAYIAEESFIGGWQHIVTVAIRPIAYDLATGRLDCYSDVVVRLNYAECEASEMESPPVFPPLPEYSPILSELVVNPPVSSKLNIQRALPSLMPMSLRYLIITTDDLAVDLERLAVWKRQKGYETEVVTIESILSNPQYAVNPANGIWDNAAALRSYIKHRFETDGEFFLLLAGNSQNGDMPVRKYYHEDIKREKVKDEFSDAIVPTDEYFVDFLQSTDKMQYEADWGIYTSLASVALAPALPVGRLACRNRDEVANYLRKLILYEAWPGKGNTEYLGKGFAFYQEDAVTRSSVNIFDAISDYVDYTYLRDMIREDDFSKRRPTGAEVIQNLKSVGLMSWLGHGNPGSIGCAGRNITKEEEDVEDYSIYKTWRYIKPTKDTSATGISNGESNNSLDLLDNVYSPAVAFSFSCTIMPFDFPYREDRVFDMGTAFTVAGRYGGVALVGNTRSGYFSRADKLEQILGEMLILNRKIGIAHQLSKFIKRGFIKNYDRRVCNLLGDPEFEVWLGRPQVSDVLISNGVNGYTVTGNNLRGCVISSYNGISEQRCDSVTKAFTNIVIPHSISADQPADRLISVWKSGTLPVMSLFADNVTLCNIEKTYSLPYVALNCNGHDNCHYILSEGSKLNILSATDIVAKNAFNISGGSLYLEGETIRIEGNNVIRNGKLSAGSRELVLDGDFVIDNSTINVFIP